MRAAVRALDRYMRRKLGVIEFWQDPDCVFRISLTTAFRDLELPDATIRKGEAVAEIHWWNEHIPAVAPGGQDLRWGVAMRRKLALTHQEMARQVMHNPDWQGLRAIGATAALFPASDVGWARRIGRLGYTVMAHENPAGRIREFFERIWFWMLWKTYQAGTLRVPSPFAIVRSEFWMSTAHLVHLYGKDVSGSH